MQIKPLIAFLATLAGLAFAPVCNAEKLTIVGVDRTENYASMTRIAMAIAIEQVNGADQGERLLVRWISGNSYQNDQLIADLQVPVAELPTVGGRYDMKGKAQRQTYIELFRRNILSTKTSTLASLQGLCPGPTASTDLNGFIMAAAEHFAAADPVDEKHLLLATDMGENTFYKVDVRLEGVAVTIYTLSIPADPAAAQRLRGQWSAAFEQWGAVSVEFMRPTISQLQWENPTCATR